jgi:uncharacterized protein YqjF (DUF2071 family)
VPPVLTVTGRDVLFVHWPLDPAAVESRVPDALDVATFDGSAWVSALAIEVRGFGPGPIRLPRRLERGLPQLVFRTYVTLEGQPGVYFLSLDTGARLPATVGRRAFGIPIHRASMRITRRGETVTFRADGELEAVAFTSSLTVEHFLDSAADRGLKAAAVDGLDGAVVGAIGEPTRATAVDHGIDVDIVPEEATFEALATRVVEAAAPSYTE